MCWLDILIFCEMITTVVLAKPLAVILMAKYTNLFSGNWVSVLHLYIKGLKITFLLSETYQYFSDNGFLYNW